MTAEHEIRHLIHRYAELLDGGRFDQVAALFAESSFGSAGRDRPLRGAAAVRGVYDGVMTYDGLPCTKHVITDVVIVPETPVAARSRCAFAVLQARPDFPLQVILAGRYHDRWERGPAGWRYAERVIFTDLVGDLSHHFRLRP